MQEPMERFINAGDECIVLIRAGDTALIVRPDCICQPYVVPLQHIRGASSWWQGRYFETLKAALECFYEEA